MQEIRGYEKVELLKDTIYQLYSKEGRNKSYISRLLKVDRKKLGEKIKEWNFEVAEHIRYMTPSSEKWLKKNKDKIISLLNKDIPFTAIANELKINRGSLLGTFIKNDKSLLHEYTLYKFRMDNYYTSEKKMLQESSRIKYYFEDLPGEEWRPILGYSKYMVSNFGRVKSYLYTLKCFQLIKPFPNKNNGRLYVALVDDKGKKHNIQLSRIVGFSFISGWSEEKNTINHKDGNVQNNNVSNLEWVSQTENNRHAHEFLPRKKDIERTFKFTKIIYEDKYEFKTINALARFLNKSPTQTRRYLEEPEKHNIKLII